MTATDLTRLPDPVSLRAAIGDIEPAIYIHGHTITTDQNRWHTCTAGREPSPEATDIHAPLTARRHRSTN